MVKREGLALEYADDELIILDKESGQVHQLNPTATVVWRGLDEGKSQAEIAAGLAQEFQIDLELATKDVATIVEQFQQLELLQSDQEDLADGKA